MRLVFFIRDVFLLPCVSSNMELHFSVVSEPLAANVTLERSLARVEADVNLEPVTVGVLAGTVTANHRRFHLFIAIKSHKLK
jgi:hypothetical protein